MSVRAISRSLAALSVGAMPALLLAAEAGAAAEHSDPAMRELLSSTVWGIIIFATVLFILWRKAFPPILKALEKREHSIRDALAAAERAKKEADAAMAKNQESLETARAEARAIIEEGKADAVRVKDGIVNDAKRESEEVKARALRDIDLAKRQAIETLHRQAAQLGVEIASRVTRKTLRAEDHDSLIQDCIRDLKEVQKAR